MIWIWDTATGFYGNTKYVNILNISAASLSHIAEELSSLLQQSHQATLSEVASRTHPVLVWGQDVIRHRRLLQHIGGDVLRGKTVS